MHIVALNISYSHDSSWMGLRGSLQRERGRALLSLLDMPRRSTTQRGTSVVSSYVE
jgi:hypothetical protein